MLLIFLMAFFMKKTISCLIFSFFVFFSCKKNDPMSIPKNKMVSMLADIHVAENASAYLSESKKDSIMKVYMNQIYEIHSVGEVEFRQNLEIIKKEPARMKEFYKQVQDTLEKRLKAVSGG
jgi:hypothetical protein